jgi:hypothetical protein
VFVVRWLLSFTPQDFGFFRSRWSCTVLALLLWQAGGDSAPAGHDESKHWPVQQRFGPDFHVFLSIVVSRGGWVFEPDLVAQRNRTC